MRIAGLTREAHSVCEKKKRKQLLVMLLLASKQKEKKKKPTSLDAEKSTLFLTEESATKFIFRFRKMKYCVCVVLTAAHVIIEHRHKD